MSELEKLVIAWRDARTEIFSKTAGVGKGDQVDLKEEFAQLAVAEAALMEYSRTLEKA